MVRQKTFGRHRSSWPRRGLPPRASRRQLGDLPGLLPVGDPLRHRPVEPQRPRLPCGPQSVGTVNSPVARARHHPAPACRLPHGSTNVYRSSPVRRLWKCHWPDYPLGRGFMPHPLRRWRLTHPPRYADQHPHHAHRRTWKNQRAHLVALRDLESGVANGIRTRNNQNHNLGFFH